MTVIELLRETESAGVQKAVPPGWYEVEAVGVQTSVTVQFLAQDSPGTWLDTGVAFEEDGVDDLVVPNGTRGLRALVVGGAGALVSLKPVRGVGG